MKEISEPFDIEGYTKFTFPGRKGKYSKQEYNFNHFSGVDYDDKTQKNGIFKILGEDKLGWADDVADEQGNADFMMFSDIDYRHGEVVEDVNNWAVWITKEVGLAGFRLDAVQHFSQRFTNQMMHHVGKETGGEKFFVGEYWSGEVDVMIEYSEKFDHRFHMYDSPLVYNFSRISTSEDADLRTVFDDTLVQKKPLDAVTVVMNHDTQPGQTVETPVEGFFQPLAHCLILLRMEGYPCVFYGSLYGMDPEGDKKEDPCCGGKLSDIMLARKLYAYGDQEDYFDKANCIGWVRRGVSVQCSSQS
jgi:alpha-amylase